VSREQQLGGEERPVRGAHDQDIVSGWHVKFLALVWQGGTTGPPSCAHVIQCAAAAQPSRGAVKEDWARVSHASHPIAVMDGMPRATPVRDGLEADEGRNNAEDFDVSGRAIIISVRNDFVHDHVAFACAFANARVFSFRPLAGILPQILDGGPDAGQPVRGGSPAPGCMSHLRAASRSLAAAAEIVKVRDITDGRQIYRDAALGFQPT